MTSPARPTTADAVELDVRQLITACLLHTGSEGDQLIAEHTVRRVALNNPRAEAISELTGLAVGLLRALAVERGEPPALTWQAHCLAAATRELGA